MKWEYQFSIEESLNEKKKYMQWVNDYRKETVQTYVLIINHGIFGHFPSKVLEGNFNNSNQIFVYMLYNSIDTKNDSRMQI